MSTPLYDLTVIDHKDLVGIHDRAEPVGNDKAGSSLL